MAGPVPGAFRHRALMSGGWRFGVLCRNCCCALLEESRDHSARNSTAASRTARTILS